MTRKDFRPATEPQAGGPHDDLLRAARLCHPDWESAGRVTFRPPFADWGVWRKEIFLPVLLPAFEAAFAAFVQGRRKELAASDAGLDRVLPQDLAGHSRRAGRLLASGYTVPNAEKVWQHYCSGVASGESPGHFAVMLAVRAAAFHLPLEAAVSVLLFLEARGGRPDGHPQEWMEMIAAARPQDRGTQLRAA